MCKYPKTEGRWSLKQRGIVLQLETLCSRSGVLLCIYSRMAHVGLRENKLQCLRSRWWRSTSARPAARLADESFTVCSFWATMELYGTEEDDISKFGYTNNWFFQFIVFFWSFTLKSKQGFFFLLNIQNRAPFSSFHLRPIAYLSTYIHSVHSQND